MKIKVNGENRKLEKVTNVNDFLKNHLQCKDTKSIAIAINGTIVLRSQWDLTIIDENDEIEIVHAVQGG